MHKKEHPLWDARAYGCYGLKRCLLVRAGKHPDTEHLLRHRNLTMFFCEKRKKGGFRREKLSENRPEIAVHQSDSAQ